MKLSEVNQALVAQDPEKSGRIAVEDFKRALKQLEPKLVLSELDTIAQVYALSGNGTLKY